ncbi:MAG: MerR family transcriptional regulator [Ramlibacter sp.]|nr:MerR family transcriptional regulator [Ramlibacter sp.]
MTRAADRLAASFRSIAEVERETGLPRATVRIWERRYGFPAPSRDDRGERRYNAEQVAQLAQMHRLVQQGHRPAKLVAAGAAAIAKLAAPAARARKSPGGPHVSAVMRLLKQHDAAGLRAELQARLDDGGLERFVSTELPVLSAMVGSAWVAGEVEVHEEHLYSSCVADVVRAAIVAVTQPVRPEAPRVLLTTVAQEHHELGLLMAHAMFALQGCPVISLGVRLPLDQIAAGARAHNAELVGLSFSAALGPSHVLRSLEGLRGLLPPQIRLWAGGNNAALGRKAIAGVRTVTDALSIAAMLAEDFALPPVGAA